ncbi:hypothetical protein SDC9_196092 [bioreactor metagenome]|uniref:Uncharacterized protein n=1 Tax=bioreactor metagenome TaxID=1076179 RepID=A0A645IB50_9ZZZZ
MGLCGGKVKISCSALGVKTAGNGNRLQKSGLPGAVFSNEECHLILERQLFLSDQVFHNRQAKNIAVVFPGVFMYF